VIRDSYDMGKLVYETGMNANVRKTLVNLNSLRQLPVDVTYETRTEALRAAVHLIEAERESAKESTAKDDPA
jgi:hypothetical protein